MITEKITSGQKKQLLRVLEDGLDASTLTKNEAEEILKVGNLVQADLKKSLEKYSISDKRFGTAIRDFVIVVPSDYNHEKQIDKFAKKVKSLKTTYYYNNDLTSENFAHATNKLEPGKKYRVRIYPILKTVKSEDCVIFLKKLNSILVGGQGITLIYELKSEEFPKGKFSVSFDEKDALWVDSVGYHRVLGVRASSDGDFEFSLGYFERERDDRSCVVSVCEILLES